MRLLLLFALFCSINLFAQEKNRAFADKEDGRWPSKNIPVCWENPTPANQKYRTMVQNAVRDSWQKEGAVDFSCWCPCQANSKGVRIKIEDTEEGPYTLGLGAKMNGVKNGMVLNFTFENWSPKAGASREVLLNKQEFYIKAIAIHEFGHALGFAHEQNRSDCKFANCDNKEQGAEGDWLITPCDPNSVMNYCNPKYANGGMLSKQDVIGLRALYGPRATKAPVENAPLDASSIELYHNAHPDPSDENYFNVDLYVSGQDFAMEQIDSVKYYLPKSFDNDEVTTTDVDNNFKLEMNVHAECTIEVEVFFKGGEKKSLEHYIDFDNELDANGNPVTSETATHNTSYGSQTTYSSYTSDNDDIHTKQRRSSDQHTYPFIVKSEYWLNESNNMYQFWIYVDNDDENFENIQKVTYKLGNNPAADSEDDTEDFTVEFYAKDCGLVTVQIEHEVNGQLVKTDYTYDLCKALELK